MNYIWRDYNPNTMGYIEAWLDESAIQSTGLDDGFRDFYEYWANEDGFVVGENFWCKVVFEKEIPFAVIALCLHEKKVTIMELLVAPEKRGQGVGSKLLKELLDCEEVIGFMIQESEAVIFPDNIRSQRAFENAGFRHHRTHKDGTAMYFVYKKEAQTMLTLRKMNCDDILEQWKYVAAMPPDENGLTNPYAGVSFGEYQASVLPTLMMHEHPVNMPDWFVPATYYYLWDGDILVGEFRIRHHLTPALRTGAGHIGYSVKKEYRGRGYGTKGLALTLDLARTIVPEEEIYLRVLKSNLPSFHAIRRNGGYIAGEDDAHYLMRIKK